ncbi:unnamed protein product, partial [marine sediment metagenome]
PSTTLGDTTWNKHTGPFDSINCNDMIIGGDCSDDLLGLELDMTISGGNAGEATCGDITSSYSASSGPSASCGSANGITPPRGLNKRKGVIKAQNAGGIVLPESAKESTAVKAMYERERVAKTTQSVKTVRPVKKLEIGAGALINQKVYRDTRDMEYWEDKPAGMLYINYCDMETLNQILEAGEIKKKSEGFMDGLKVGS